MDRIRSCYSTVMRWGPEDDAVGWVDWFFCDDDAKDFPFPHRFGSNNWLSKNWPIPDEPGEIDGAPRPWRDGSMPAAYLGQHFCGEADWYLNGVSSPTPPTPERDASGVPACCNDGPAGAAAGGEAILVFPVNTYSGGGAANGEALLQLVYFPGGGGADGEALVNRIPGIIPGGAGADGEALVNRIPGIIPGGAGADGLALVNRIPGTIPGGAGADGEAVVVPFSPPSGPCVLDGSFPDPVTIVISGTLFQDGTYTAPYVSPCFWNYFNGALLNVSFQVVDNGDGTRTYLVNVDEFFFHYQWLLVAVPPQDPATVPFQSGPTTAAPATVT